MEFDPVARRLSDGRHERRGHGRPVPAVRSLKKMIWRFVPGSRRNKKHNPRHKES